MSAMEEHHEVWRALCLSMPGTYEDFPFGEHSTVFKVAGRDRAKGKMFALLMVHQGELLLNLKCEPAIAERLRDEHEQITGAYHMNKRHWNSVRVGLDPQVMRELVEDSYDLVIEAMPARDRSAIQIKRHTGGG
ncbi:MmcQ/YjbR family DNA-binding protein [Glutamicibacter creatinolyticus]|uniref:MmcQ/YjbR family DNA-binding protein n=1 Tax=Glutamicibacter creatinolyticus TaxID=162496 RepID=UPI0032173B38